MEQEMNKKEQQLQDNNIKINNLKKSKKLLIRGLKKQERIHELKTKENNELKNEIKKLEKSKIELSGLPKFFEDIEKENKARNFAPPDEDEERLKNLKTKLQIESKEIPEDFDINELFRDEENEHLNINLGDANNLFDTIKKCKKKDNIIDLGDNKSINFNDIIDFSKDIIDGKINNSNKEKKYNKKFKDIEKNLENRTKYTNIIKIYIINLNQLKKILFTPKKSSGKGLTISSLPILLSNLYINNGSKEIINEITQLTKKLYDNKQITKQLYDILKTL